MLDLDQLEVKKISFKYKGKEYHLSEPTVKDVRGLNKSLKNGDEELDCMIGFLDGLGFPASVSEEMGILALRKVTSLITEGMSEKK